MMLSPIVKRSIAISGRETSVSLEDAFWIGLKEIAVSQKLSLTDLVADIDSRREGGNLSSAIRLFVLGQLRTPMTGAPPTRTGNGAVTDVAYNASQFV